PQPHHTVVHAPPTATPHDALPICSDAHVPKRNAVGDAPPPEKEEEEHPRQAETDSQKGERRQCFDGVLDQYEGRSPDKGDQKQNGIGDPPVGDAVQTFSSSSSPFNIFLHLTTIARNVGWDSPSREGENRR